MCTPNFSSVTTYYNEICVVQGVFLPNFKNLNVFFYPFLLRFRGLQLSTSLYLKTFKCVTSDTVMFDILHNNLEKLLQSSLVLRMIDKLGASKFIIKHRSLSYNVTTETGNEQFEKLLIARTPMVIGILVVEWFCKYSFHLLIFIFSVFFSIIFNNMLS